MNENRKKILEMLAQNKISADEAYQLLGACDEGGREKTRVEPDTRVKPKYLRLTVTPGEGHADHAHAERRGVGRFVDLNRLAVDPHLTLVQHKGDAVSALQAKLAPYLRWDRDLSLPRHHRSHLFHRPSSVM